MPEQKQSHEAEALDQLLNALQQGQEPPHLEGVDETDIALAQAIVGLVKETKPDPHFAHNTENVIQHLPQRVKATRTRWSRWVVAGNIAAVFIMLIGVTVYFMSGVNLGEKPEPNITENAMVPANSPTPAATITLTLPAVGTAYPPSLNGLLTATSTGTQAPLATGIPPTLGVVNIPATLGPGNASNPVQVTVLPVLPTAGNAGSVDDATMVAVHPTGTPAATSVPNVTATPSPMPTQTSSPEATSTALATSASAPTQPVTQSDGDVSTVTPISDFQSSLEAGEIDDNAEFNVYLQYRRDFTRYQNINAVHDVDIAHRHTIKVLNTEDYPVLGATVTIYDTRENLVTELTTTATGLVYFFPRAYPTFADTAEFLVVISYDEASASFNLTREETDMEWLVVLDVPPAQAPIKVDILFLVDSTGSMSDEINELKLNILSMSAQIDNLDGDPDVRYGLVTYRDRRDTYVVQTTDFTGDVGEFQTTLSQLQANGGGDYPESLNEALYNAVSEVSWRGEDTIKIIILVGDAPPHLDYAQDNNYAEEILLAAEQGIKIHTIASSGLSDVGEYIFRQIAQFTGGNFIFLAYEDKPQSASSNEPGAPGTDHNIPEQQYTVEYLDALVVRLIEAEIAAVQTRE